MVDRKKNAMRTAQDHFIRHERKRHDGKREGIKPGSNTWWGRGQPEAFPAAVLSGPMYTEAAAAAAKPMGRPDPREREPSLAGRRRAPPAGYNASGQAWGPGTATLNGGCWARRCALTHGVRVRCVAGGGAWRGGTSMAAPHRDHGCFRDLLAPPLGGPPGRGPTLWSQ